VSQLELAIDDRLAKIREAGGGEVDAELRGDLRRPLGLPGQDLVAPYRATADLS
jgi:hypothetical protein